MSNSTSRFLKIALICNSLGGGGAEKTLVELANYWNSAGHRVVIYTIDGAPQAYRTDEGIVIRPLLPWTSQGWLRDLMLLPQTLSLAFHLAWLKPDFVLSFLQRSNFLNILRSFFSRSQPVYVSEQVATDICFSGDTLKDKVTLWMVKKLYPRARRIFCASGGVQESLSRLGIPLQKTEVIHNPVNLESAALATQTIPSKSRTIANIGRLVPQKNQALLIRALAPVLLELDARLLILGEGELQHSLQQLASRLGVGERVELAGWTDNPYDLLQRSELFVLSSNFEGFGNVLVEAMACGLPVVSTDCPSGPSEVLEEGKSGLLVPTGDEEALRAAVRSILTDTKLKERLQERSRVRARDFEVRIIAERFLRSACFA